MAELRLDASPARATRRAAAVLLVTTVGGCVAILGDDFAIGPETSGTSSSTDTSTDTTLSSTETSSSTSTETAVPCSQPSECDSGLCVDGFCCDSDCDGACVACDVEGRLGECTPLPAGSDDAACATGLCDGTGSCAAGTLEWAFNMGDAVGQWGREVTVDGQGNVVAVGHFDGGISFPDATYSTGTSDLYVAKYGPDGTLAWSRAFGDGGNAIEFPQAVATDAAGNITVAGTFTGSLAFEQPHTASPAGAFNIFLVKLTPDGDVLWSRAFATESDFFFLSTVALDVDANGSIVLGASVLGPVDLGGGALTELGGWDFVVGRFDANGDHQWSERYGGTGPDGVLGVCFDAAGDLLVAGSFSGTVDFRAPDGERTSAGALDAFLLKMSGGGAEQWVLAWGDNLWQAALDVAADADRNILVAGAWAGTVDFGGGPLYSADTPEPFIAKLTPDGDYLWAVRGGESVTDGWTTSVEATAGGAVVAGGWFGGTASFGGAPLTATETDGFLLTLGPDGGVVWTQSFGTALGDSVQGMSLDPTDGSIAITGYLGNGTMTIGGLDLVSAGGADAFVAKLSR